MKFTIEEIEKTGQEVIDRAQREKQPEDWHMIPGWDINAWRDDDNQWRITLYPATAGETDSGRGIVIRGDHVDGCYDFPSIQTLQAALSDKAIATELSQWWSIHREDNKLLVCPARWGKDAPILEIDLQKETV